MKDIILTFVLAGALISFAWLIAFALHKCFGIGRFKVRGEVLEALHAMKADGRLDKYHNWILNRIRVLDIGLDPRIFMKHQKYLCGKKAYSERQILALLLKDTQTEFPELPRVLAKNLCKHAWLLVLQNFLKEAKKNSSGGN